MFVENEQSANPREPSCALHERHFLRNLMLDISVVDGLQRLFGQVGVNKVMAVESLHAVRLLSAIVLVSPTVSFADAPL